MTHAAMVMAELSRQHEEEALTNYKAQDLQGWEFKIVRSATSQFKDPLKLQQAVAQEAEFGWELVEKFDNQRLRFKRPTSARNLPAPSGSDPYRAEYGISEGALVFSVIGAITLGLVLLGALVSLFVN